MGGGVMSASGHVDRIDPAHALQELGDGLWTHDWIHRSRAGYVYPGLGMRCGGVRSSAWGKGPSANQSRRGDCEEDESGEGVGTGQRQRPSPGK